MARAWRDVQSSNQAINPSRNRAQTRNHAIKWPSDLRERDRAGARGDDCAHVAERVAEGDWRERQHRGTCEIAHAQPRDERT
eukprot:5982900-Prymnesium_polylepis.1